MKSEILKQIADNSCELSLGLEDGILSIMFKKKIQGGTIGEACFFNIDRAPYITPKDFDIAIEDTLKKIKKREETENFKIS